MTPVKLLFVLAASLIVMRCADEHHDTRSRGDNQTLDEGDFESKSTENGFQSDGALFSKDVLNLMGPMGGGSSGGDYSDPTGSGGTGGSGSPAGAGGGGGGGGYGADIHLAEREVHARWNPCGEDPYAESPRHVSLGNSYSLNLVCGRVDIYAAGFTIGAEATGAANESSAMVGPNYRNTAYPQFDLKNLKLYLGGRSYDLSRDKGKDGLDFQLITNAPSGSAIIVKSAAGNSLYTFGAINEFNMQNPTDVRLPGGATITYGGTEWAPTIDYVHPKFGRIKLVYLELQPENDSKKIKKVKVMQEVSDGFRQWKTHIKTLTYTFIEDFYYLTETNDINNGDKANFIYSGPVSSMGSSKSDFAEARPTDGLTVSWMPSNIIFNANTMESGGDPTRSTTLYMGTNVDAVRTGGYENKVPQITSVTVGGRSFQQDGAKVTWDENGYLATANQNWGNQSSSNNFWQYGAAGRKRNFQVAQQVDELKYQFSAHNAVGAPGVISLVTRGQPIILAKISYEGNSWFPTRYLDAVTGAMTEIEGPFLAPTKISFRDVSGNFEVYVISYTTYRDPNNQLTQTLPTKITRTIGDFSESIAIEYHNGEAISVKLPDGKQIKLSNNSATLTSIADNEMYKIQFERTFLSQFSKEPYASLEQRITANGGKIELLKKLQEIVTGKYTAIFAKSTLDSSATVSTTAKLTTETLTENNTGNFTAGPYGSSSTESGDSALSSFATGHPTKVTSHPVSFAIQNSSSSGPKVEICTSTQKFLPQQTYFESRGVGIAYMGSQGETEDGSKFKIGIGASNTTADTAHLYKAEDDAVNETFIRHLTGGLKGRKEFTKPENAEAVSDCVVAFTGMEGPKEVICEVDKKKACAGEFMLMTCLEELREGKCEKPSQVYSWPMPFRHDDC